MHAGMGPHEVWKHVGDDGTPDAKRRGDSKRPRQWVSALAQRADGIVDRLHRRPRLEQERPSRLSDRKFAAAAMCEGTADDALEPLKLPRRRCFGDPQLTGCR